jgi:iron complex outermembrane receptor protein
MALGAMVTPNAVAQVVDDDGTFIRDEIIVTARKREENLQDVPIAISVFSGDALDKRGIVDIQGLSQRTPGFTVAAKDAASSQFSIRGIGSVDDGAAADNSVIVYVDDVPIGRAAGMDLDLFDLERVEVLRGPQGTLFGRNAVGGAISLVTKKPTEELEIKAEVKVGNFNRLDFRGLVSGQIAENLYGKISFSSRNRDGYLDSTIDRIPNSAALFPNLSQSFLKDINALDVDRSTLRAGLRYVPNDALEINLSGSYSTLNQSGPQRVFRGIEQQFGVGANLLVPGVADDFHSEFFEDPGFAKIDSYSETLHVDYTFDNDYTLTSISSVRSIETFINDVISTDAQTRAVFGATFGFEFPANLGLRPISTILISPASNDFSENSTTYTQEFRLTSPAGKRLEWVAGVFYLHEDVRRNETVNLGLLQRQGDGTVNVLVPAAESGDDQGVSINSYAAFAQGTYEIMEGLELTAGIRYTSDTKDITRLGTADGIVVSAPFFVENSATFDEVTPKVVLSYKPNDNWMVYGSYSRGFKSGGFQGRGTSAASVTPPFDPETADTYEAGIKATLLGGRLQINPTVFHTDFTDLQVVFLLRPVGSPPGTTSSLVTSNAANADVDGVEIEYSFYPFDGLTLSGSATYLDATFVEFFTPLGFETEDGQPLSNSLAGNTLLNSPKYSMSHLVRYEWDVPALNGSLAAQGEYVYREKTFGSNQNDPNVSLPTYNLVNLSLTYARDGDHHSEFSLWVDNVTDQDYLTQVFTQDRGGRATPGEPRMYGATFRWKY